MKEQLLNLLGSKAYFPADAAGLARHLALRPAQQRDLRHALNELEQTGRVARIKGHRYILPREADLIPGRIRMNRQGKGFLDPDDEGLKEIEIPESATGTALHEDRVLVRRDVRARGLRPDGPLPNTGSVVRVLERRRSQIVGTLQESRHFLYVIPDDPRIPHDIYVPEPRDVGRRVEAGDKVVVELRDWQSRHTNPEGEVVEVLGPPDAEGVDMLSVLRQYDLPLRFPPAVLEEARRIGTVVADRDLKERVDCRAHGVITIDPDDAKDFDDAFYLEPAERGQWRLWVHIADVSHYVRPGSPLDVEARKRGNSTYLVDRVIPMLPEALSNELCSLKPQVDRLTRCVEFRLSDTGRVLSTKFYSAVIHSKRRFSYQEAFAVLQRKPEGPIEEMLHRAHEVAQKIRRERFRAGSLALDFPEMKIRLDERGRVDRIEKVVNDVSHQLIEEFMLLANEAVAARLMALKRPAVYRIHEPPDERRLREYREDVLSHNVPCGNLSQRTEVQKLLHRLDGLPIGPALKIGFLKSLMRARYAVEPLGHYGLAKAKYTHFTSPIRRYSDLVVHRALFEQVGAGAVALKETADHLSVTERNSADAERDSKDVKMYAYLRAQVESGSPVSYPALVTDVRNFGFFVDVPDLAMGGLVPLSMLEDDFYVFDPARSRLVGRRTRRVVGLGDRPLVQIAKVDSFKKQVDFRLASSSGKTGLPVSAHGGRAGNQRFPGTGEGPRRRGGRGGSSVGTKTAERKPVKPSGSDFRDGPKGSGRGGRGGSSGPRPSPAGGPRSGRRTR
ncbi:MAG: ribonuclease R [Limisphaerales bacterium]